MRKESQTWAKHGQWPSRSARNSSSRSRTTWPRYEQVYHRKLTQKEFVIGLIEQAIEESDEEFEAAEAAEAEDATEAVEAGDTVDEIEDYGQEDEVTNDVEMGEDAQPADAPESDAEADAALADCAGGDAGNDGPAFCADAAGAV